MTIYSGPIVDPHMHLWDLSMDKHPGLRPGDNTLAAIKGIEKLRRNWLVEDYRDSSQAQPIVGTVHIEANWDAADPLGETKWLDSLDKTDGIAARYIAGAPAAALIEQQARNPRIAGFRSIVSFHPTKPEKSWVRSPDILESDAWRRDVALLAKRGLILELMLYPYQADGAVAVAQAFPDLQIVLNHSASPIDQDDKGMTLWRAALKRLAKPANVALKVNMVGYNPNPTFEMVQAMVLHCIECFGPERSMFATDWPVASRYTTFDGIYDIFRRIVAPMSEAEQKSLFHDTAARLYRMQGLLSDKDGAMRRAASRKSEVRMIRWLIRRIIVSAVLVWVVATIVFMSLHLVPGDPAELLLSGGGVAADPAAVAALRDQLGLNRPLIDQYASFLASVSQGDLGNSIIDNYSVSDEISKRLPRTLELIIAALAIAVVFGIPSGVYAGLNRGGAFDRIVSTATTFFLAIPVFVFGTLLVLLLAQTLRLMPAGGYTPFAQNPGQHLELLALPAFTIGIGLIAVVFRMMRASILDASSRDFVRTARAKGLSPWRVILRHIMRNAMSPVVTVLGLHMGTLLGGTVLVEYVFNWPGLSTPLLEAVQARDYPMVAGIVLTISVLFLFINLVMDIIYAVLDPRVRA